MRVGHGFDVHRFGGSDPLVLAGVVIPGASGVLATSDGDVLVHAVIDGMLGAAALGDLGEFYPSSDPRWRNSSSSETLLPDARDRVRAAGWVVSSLDCTIVAEHVRVAPHRTTMRANLAAALQLEMSAVSIKATTTDGLGGIGAGEGLAASAIVVLAPAEGDQRDH